MTTSTTRRLLSQPPWHFRLAKHLIRARRRGAYRLIELAEWLGCLSCDVRYELARGVGIDVPLDRRPNQWALPDLLEYETALVNEFVLAGAEMSAPVRWVDVGADIGAMSALVISRTPQVTDAWAFEPNQRPFDYLERNVKRLPIPATARRCAIGERSGRGDLRNSATDDSDHAMFLVPDETGKLEVVRLDDLFAWNDGSLLLKIDVEGGELAVLRGGENLLRRLPNWCVSLEAHRDVSRRTGLDPSSLVRWLSDLRPVTVHIAERPELVIDWRRDYFAQVPAELKIANVVCRTTTTR